MGPGGGVFAGEDTSCAEAADTASAQVRFPPLFTLRWALGTATPASEPGTLGPGRHYHSSCVLLPGYLFFCEEGMWGIYHRALASAFGCWAALP